MRTIFAIAVAGLVFAAVPGTLQAAPGGDAIGRHGNLDAVTPVHAPHCWHDRLGHQNCLHCWHDRRGHGHCAHCWRDDGGQLHCG